MQDFEENPTVALAEIGKLAEHRVGAADHGSELQHVELLAVEADAFWR